MKLKKLLNAVLSLSFVFCLGVKKINGYSSDGELSGNENYSVVGEKIVYNGFVYDLSNPLGIYELTFNNREMSANELSLILSQIQSNEQVGIEPYQSIPNDNTPGGAAKYVYFYSMDWFYRDADGWNLSLDPTSITRGSYAKMTSGWDEVVKEQKSSSHWYNASSLKGQYVCHYYFANKKAKWNIAPSIPDKGAFEWVVDKCN